MRLARIATVLATIGVAATVTGLAVEWALPAQARTLTPNVHPVVGLAAGPVGALVCSRHPRHAVGWLMALVGLLAGLFVAMYAATDAGLARPDVPGWTVWTAWAAGVASAPVTMVGLALLPQVFPDGHPLPGRFWRAWWRASLVLTGAFTLLILTSPLTVFGLPSPLWPTGTADEVSPAALDLPISLVLAALVLGSLVSVVFRFVRAPAPERRRIGALLAAQAFVLLAEFGRWDVLPVIASVVLFAVILVGVVRFGLWDVPVLVSRSTVGVLLLAVFALVHAGTTGLIGGVLGRSGGSGVAAFAGAVTVALVLDPLRRRVRTAVDRAFTPGHADPRELAAVVSATIAAGPPGRSALDAAATLLAQRLHLPGLRIDTAPPAADTDHVLLPLRVQGVSVGSVVVPGAGASPAALRSLDTVTPVLALAAHDAHTTGELERSRQAIVAAREEERRRLRSELHDGLGPALAGSGHLVEVARSAATRRPERTVQLLADVEQSLRESIRTLRAITNDLRPPALDDLGLARAIRHVVPATSPLDLVVEDGDLEDSGRRLPAAVEVAAYRIAQEALTNVLKHARASSARVELAVRQDVLVLRVADDGRGLGTEGSGGPDPVDGRGIGLSSMRDRAAELGGRLTVRNRSGGGTVVTAELPLGAGKEGDG